jgi:ERCC4-related helicase
MMNTTPTSTEALNSLSLTIASKDTTVIQYLRTKDKRLFKVTVTLSTEQSDETIKAAVMPMLEQIAQISKPGDKFEIGTANDQEEITIQKNKEVLNEQQKKAIEKSSTEFFALFLPTPKHPDENESSLLA